jgi:cation:H+ antiporter
MSASAEWVDRGFFLRLEPDGNARPSQVPDGGALARLGRAQVAFVAIFVCKVALAFRGKPFTGLLFLAVYAVYFWHELPTKDRAANGALDHALGVPGHIIVLFLSPIATELPETMNAVIWVRQRSERLALANLSGVMMTQATVLTAFGLLFTPRQFDAALAAGAAATLASVGSLRLALSALGYVLFGGLFALAAR